MTFLKKQFANVNTPSPRGGFGVGVILFMLLTLFVSCTEDEQEYDPYYDWQVRNETWFRQIADSARTAIAEARAQYGDEWENYCQWRMVKRLDQSKDYNTGRVDDSICVRMISRGAGSVEAGWSDTVRISYRGWMMPTVYKDYDAEGQLVDRLRQEVFDQSYYGKFDTETAAPVLASVSSFIVGYYTALQYMVEGDDWMVYIPYRLGYGESDHGTIPAYSTLQFRIHMAAVYPCNTGVPAWKARRR